MTERESGKVGLTEGLVEDLAYGVAVAEADRRLSYVNRRARELLMPVAAAGSGNAPLASCEGVCGHPRLGPRPPRRRGRPRRLPPPSRPARRPSPAHRDAVGGPLRRRGARPPDHHP